VLLLPLIAELNRRRVFRALVGYGVVAFAILQIAEPVIHGLRWSDSVLSYVVVALASGFPIVVTIAWVFDVNAGRIERMPASGTLRGPRLALVLLGIGVLAAAPGLVWYFMRPPRRASAVPVASIAVLPFVNMSSDKENEYFSDGITEELINALSNVEGLKVASRTSVFALKGSNLDARQIGEKLNVGTLLEGSIRRERNTVRITAQLVEVHGDVHLWSQTYDRRLDGIFVLEAEIAQAIAETLRRKLLDGGARRVPTTNLEAHDLYLKGRYFGGKRNLDALHKADGQFEAAVRLDPQYALAWAGLADNALLRIDYADGAQPALLSRARTAALHAIELESGLAEAHTSLAYVANHQLDWTAAEREYRIAIGLKPDNATAHQWYAEMLSQLGRLPEARTEIRSAVQLEPTSLIIASINADIYVIEREFEKAAQEHKRALEMDPSFARSRLLLSQTYAFQGKYEEALAELDSVRQWPVADLEANRAYVLARAGRTEDARRVLRQIEIRPLSESMESRTVARVYLALGNPDLAFSLLEQSCSAPNTRLSWTVRMEPLLDPLRANARFKSLLRCMRIPER